MQERARYRKGFLVRKSNLARVFTIVGAAALATVLGTTSATAARGNWLIAETIGVYGSTMVTYGSKTHLSEIDIRVVDTASDGHHVRTRIITKRSNGSLAYWAWRANYGGLPTEKEWTTFLTDSQGIIQVQSQACVAEGSTLIRCAYSPWKTNPYA
ncbi:hypothetical protein [Streptomyces thermolilacinus]|uniref:hypothetical protein n=1 Tax=Streptomyces thermolilacinus TaxID=285540 RepID=UPI0033FD951F